MSGWATAIKETPVAKAARATLVPTSFPVEPVDWDRLVTIDFETYYDADYTLNKLSTSEYIRDLRFKAQMVGIKIGTRKTKVVPAARIKTELRKISWETHSVLCHNAQFDAFILSHHYGIKPKKIYCTLSMARGLHSNEIGAGLDEVSKFYGGKGKIEGGLEPTKGVLNWPVALVKSAGVYCANDVDETYRVFRLMVPQFPRDEVDLIDLTVKMFTDPVLQVDLARVEKELAREIARRRELMLSIAKLIKLDDPELIKSLTKAERELEGEERTLLLVKKCVGSNERFAALLRTQGVEPPKKISPAWMKKSTAERAALPPDAKYAYAFAKDDQDFVTLPDNEHLWSAGLNLNKKASVMELAVRAARIRALIETRLAVKSTTNITRAERFLKAGADGMPLPCGYAYFRAHTGRWGGNNKMNMQNLTRGGELRQSILAPKGHQIAVADSGQIEARVNAWLWGQYDLLDAFKSADAYEARHAHLPEHQRPLARGDDRDAYCRFGDVIYGREILKTDKLERFIAKTATLGLGFQMGPAKFQLTLAKGTSGPPVYFTLKQCEEIVNKYRRKNHRIEQGWRTCKVIIEQMAAGVSGSHKCLTWGKGFIALPNGMTLKYPDLKKSLNAEKGYEEWTYQSGPNRKKIYGGLLCENIVQALARIIVGYQMLAISRKHRVVMTTHDEVVACIKRAQASSAFTFMVRTMRTPLAWCPDLPLNAEGGVADNYSK